MSYFISQKLNNYLIEKNIVDEENKELVAFGIHDIIMYFLTILPIFCFSLVLNMVWQCAVYLVGFILLRIYAGGFHAKTELRCYIASVLQVCAVLLVLKWVPWTSTICIVVMLLSAITILAYAPLEDANKPLCVAEISAYKTRTRIIILLEILIIITAILVSLVTLSACLGLALLTNSISILLSEMKRSFVKKEEKET